MLLFLICIIIMYILVLWCYTYIYLLLTNSFGLLNSQKITKKKVRDKSIFVLLRILIWIKQFFVFIFLHPMYVVNFMFGVCMLWDWNSRMVWDYYFTISRKRGQWKFWLDFRFPRDSKLKWILKWLPLDRGYFKFYFLQKTKVY